jgi:hypothetical protein
VAGLALRQELIHLGVLPAALPSVSPAAAPRAPAPDGQGLPMVTVLAVAMSLLVGLFLVVRAVSARSGPSLINPKPGMPPNRRM